METSIKTNKIVMTSLMMCLIIITTMFFKIPIPFANGYVHLGDAMIFLSVIIVGWKYGAIAAAVGSALGDILGGFAIWAPWTLVIKGLMAVILGSFIVAVGKKNANQMRFGISFIQLIGMILAGLWMMAGYYIAEGCIYGNWIAPMLGIPWNIGQFTVGTVIAVAITSALYKTPVKHYFIQ